MSAVNSQWQQVVPAESVVSTPAAAHTYKSWATVSALPSYPTWVDSSVYNLNVSSRPHYHACWQRNQTGPIVGALFGGIALGLIIAGWIAMFIAWKRAKARAVRAIRDLEQRVGRDSYDSEEVFTPDSARSEEKLPLIFHSGREGDGRRSAVSVDDSPR